MAQKPNEENKHWGWTDFRITSALALVVAALDIAVFHFTQGSGQETERIVLMGIVTFFGMLTVSAHHEHVKNNDKANNSDTSKSKTNKSPKYVDGEILRTSIAATLVLVYVVVLGHTLYDVPNDTASLCDYSSNSTKKSPDGTSQIIQCKEHTIRQNVLDNFGNVIMVVIGAYFGSKGAIQIFKIHKGISDTSTTKENKGGAKPAENKDGAKPAENKGPNK